MALNMSAALNITANVQGAQGVTALNTQLKQLGKQGEISAGQLRQAFQTLPAQFQDVAVSLAGGQNPFMVLLQQGSQVATQFGGVGNAIRGIMSVLTPARLAFGGLAGAVGAFAVAAVQGYQESIQLQRQIAITGNFAGATADSFERAAGRIQKASGATALATRDMLSGAIGSGSFGPASIEAATAAMTRLQKLTGQSSEEIVKNFSGMSKGVADWAVEANRAYNFLSVEQYRYIRQLEEQGRKEAAIAFTSNALNQSLGQRTIELGYLEKAWSFVKTEAAGAWNAMMNVGREETLTQQLSKLEQLAANAKALRDGMAKRGQNVPSGESPESMALAVQIENLKESIKLQDRAAERTADRAAANQTAIQKEREAEGQRKIAATEAKNQEKQRLDMIIGLQSEITKLTAGETALTVSRLRRLGATEREIAQATALMERRDQIVAALKAEEDAKKESDKNDSSRKQMLQELSDAVLKLSESEDELTISRLRRVGASQIELDQAREMMAQRRSLTDAEKERTEAERKSKQQAADRTQTIAGLTDQVYALSLGEDELALARLRGLGASEAEIESAQRLQKTLIGLREAQRLKEEGSTVTQAVRTPEEVLADEIARMTKLRDADLISLETYTRAIAKARDAYLDLGKKGGDIMADLRNAIEGWGRSSADAFVDFAFSAKDAAMSVEDSFKSMVTNILKDIARMLIYRNVTQPLFSAISGMLPFANGGIMTDQGSMPLNRYANGGIANSPQLAMFGEGRMPEAYVPLPDGRSIPVTMNGNSGGDTNVVVNVNMDAGQTKTQGDSQRGTDLGMVIAGVVKQELINQRRPGGLLAA